MGFTWWYVLGGVLLVAMAMADSLLRRLPLSTPLLYLVFGVVLGPLALGVVDLTPLDAAEALERMAEVVVIISLFAAGLKLRAPLQDRRWGLPAALASVGMVFTVGIITAAGWWLLGLPLGGAVLLGAVLAPTDPVLASDVQVEEPSDGDRLRFALTGEAGLNDGMAFPFVMLGLGLLGLHELGPGGSRWLAVDLVWAVAAGLGTGALLGNGVGRLVVYLRHEHREAVGLDDFLALGLISLSYGVAHLLHAYGFLAVFAAGVALRRIERERTGDDRPPPDVEAAARREEVEEEAMDPDVAPAYMAQAVLGFSEQLERIGTVAAVLLVGAMLEPAMLTPPVLWAVPIVLFLVRPIAVAPVLAFTSRTRMQRWLVAWFGIRGIGSLYYLFYAVSRGVPEQVAELLVSVTLSVVAGSVLLHGLTATPFMRTYSERHEPREA